MNDEQEKQQNAYTVFEEVQDASGDNTFANAICIGAVVLGLLTAISQLYRMGL